MAHFDVNQVFKDFLQQHKLERDKLLLMVSGGVDSVVLLHAAAQVVKVNNLAVFHLNHNAREESKDDAIFVQNLCSSLNIKCYSEALVLPASPNGGGIEASWRKSRQTLSQKAANDFGAAKILTAHHATDLVETMIFRLTKGCGPAGLSPFDTSTKPFWELPKQALLDYAKAHHLEWREDKTNLNTKFERNLIRAEVLPVLRKVTPNLEQVFVRESKTFAQTTDFLSLCLLPLVKGGWGDFPAEYLENKSVPLKHFLKLPQILQTELLRHIAAKTPSQAEMDDCLKWLTGNPAGNSEKNIGGTKLKIKDHNITWVI